MKQVEFCNTLFSYEFHKKRGIKNIRYIYKDGVLIIYGPVFSSEKLCLKILKQHEDKMYRFIMNRSYKKLEEGSKINLLEEEYTIHFADEYKLIDQDIYLKADFTDKEFYKLTDHILYEYVSKRQKEIIKNMYLFKKNPEVKVKLVSSYYGCYNKKNHCITYNSVIIQANKECVDYIIYHELSHIHSMHHDYEFYKMMDKYCPNHKYLRQKLRKEVGILC